MEFCVLLHFRSYSCNKPQKRSNQLRTRFVTLVHKTRGDMSFVTFSLIQLVISRKMGKSHKNTICDTCAQNSWRYEFSDIFAHTVVISRKKRSNQVRTRFATFVHRTRGDTSFVTFSLIQLE